MLHEEFMDSDVVLFISFFLMCYIIKVNKIPKTIIMTVFHS